MSTFISSINVELPIDWFLNPVDGHRHRDFYVNVMGALLKSHTSINVTEAPWGSDFSARQAPDNGVLFSFHSVGEAKNVWRLKEAPIPPLYAIDRLGHSGWSEIANSSELQLTAKKFNIYKANSIIKNYKEKFLKTRESKYHQNNFTEDLPNEYVFIPLQVQSDPVAKFAYIDAILLLKTAAKFALQNEIHVVVKRHPYCDSLAIEAFTTREQKNNSFFHVSQGNIHTIIENCLSVVTVNSGVGLEALIHGKPVYSCGLSEWFPASHQLFAPEHIERAFNRVQPKTSSESIAYLGFLLSEYWVDGSDFDKVAARINNCMVNELQQLSVQLDDTIMTSEKLSINTEIGIQKRKISQLEFDLRYNISEYNQLSFELKEMAIILNEYKNSIAIINKKPFHHAIKQFFKIFSSQTPPKV